MSRNDPYENLEKYFKDGLSYDEIILFLRRFDGIDISKRNQRFGNTFFSLELLKCISTFL